jgi:protein phosphatase
MLWIGIAAVVAAIVAFWLARGWPSAPARNAPAPGSTKAPGKGAAKAAGRAGAQPSPASGKSGASAPKKAGASGRVGMHSPAAGARPAPARAALPRAHDDSEEDDQDITMVTLGPPTGTVPSMSLHDDDDDDGEDGDEDTLKLEEAAVPILFDATAALDEPTRPIPLILVSAAAQTDPGLKRRKNEDSFLVQEDHGVFVVADGMGGYAGGEIASRTAVEVIAKAFQSNTFVGKPHTDVPRRGSELVLAIQRANQAIYEKARDRDLQGMGTTLVGARFSPNKQRLYVGHVGDSRCYRFRDGRLTQMTTDHTLAAEGLIGPLSSRLSRAVGIAATVKVDLLIARPIPLDLYLLCSDGLSKMVSDEQVEEILRAESDVKLAVEKLVAKANESGGRDNITVILVQVTLPFG